MKTESKSWLIIDDDHSRAVSLVGNIAEEFPADPIYVLLTNLDSNDEFQYGIKEYPGVNTSIKHFGRLEDLVSEIAKLEDIKVILAEVVLDGVLDQDLRSRNNPLLKIFEEKLNETKEQLLCLTTSKTNPKIQQKAFSDINRSRVFYDYDLDSTDPAEHKNLIRKVHRRWSELFLSHPVDVYLRNMSTRFSAPPASGHENHNHNWRDMENFPPQQLIYLAEFLDYQVDSFVNLLSLQPTDNPIGECLKVMGTRDKKSLPLLGVVLIAYSVFRKYPGKRPQEIEDQFIEILLSLNEKSNLDEKRAKAGKISRYENFLPPQEEDQFNGSLRSLYNMFKGLFFHENALKLAKVRLDDTEFTLIISGIRAHEMVDHLNQYLANLLNNNNQPDHDSISGTGIIDFWIRSNLSYHMSRDKVHGPEIAYWANSNAFHIESRNEKTLALIFKI